MTTDQLKECEHLLLRKRRAVRMPLAFWRDREINDISSDSVLSACGLNGLSQNSSVRANDRRCNSLCKLSLDIPLNIVSGETYEWNVAEAGKQMAVQN
jgi:hypothetical protein